MGLKPSTSLVLLELRQRICFRPLAGLWVWNKHPRDGGSLSKFVSVPLRGNGYESIGLSHGKSHLNLSMVSVPLRGNGYETKVLSRYKAIAETFPSPCGEMGMKPYTHLLHEIIKGRVFPSPCGEMGMKQSNGVDRYWEDTLCFCPLAGKWVWNSNSATKMAITKLSFRPLAGKWVWNVKQSDFMTTWIIRVSVPLRGNGYETLNL